MEADDSTWDAAVAVILYCALSPVLTWLNKFVLIVPFCSQGLRGGPFLVVFFQQVSTFFVLSTVRLASQFFSNFGKLSKIQHVNHNSTLKGRPTSTLPSLSVPDFSDAIELAPAALCFVAQLTACNACLRAIPMSSYQATRSSSLIFSILVNRLILFEPISLSAFISSSIVGIGFVLSVFDPAQSICYSSVTLGIFASLAGVLFMTLCRQKVRQETLSEADIARWISFDSSLFLLPFVLYEFTTIYEYGSVFFSPAGSSSVQGTSPSSSLSSVGAALMATMLLAPLIPLCTTTCLRYMTPLGCTIVGFAKSCAQTVIGNWMFGDPLSSRSLFGVALCLTGCCMYSFSGKKAKRKQSVSQEQSKDASSKESQLLRKRSSLSGDFECFEQSSEKLRRRRSQTKQNSRS